MWGFLSVKEKAWTLVGDKAKEEISGISTGKKL